MTTTAPTTTPLDLLVIGAGSGGVAIARRAALHGARVAIVEAGRVGGTCVLRGCVPKKLLMYAAAGADALDDARSFGWTIPEAGFEMARWAAAKAAEISRLEGVYRRMLAEGGVELIEGRASLVEPGRVRIGERVVAARRVVIATGSAPVTDTLPGIDACPTSDELLELTALPASAAVLGGGYVAVEFASMLARLGVAVEMCFRDVLPLRGFDPMLRQAAAEALAAAGVVLRPGGMPQRVEATGRGFTLHGPDGTRREWPWVLNATGRRPMTRGLGLEALGVELGAHGEVPVDETLATPLPGVYAIGDVTNRRNLTPVAIAEGRALADTLFGGGPRRVDLSRVASAVFMLPPLATIGPGEDELAASGRRIDVYEADFKPMLKAFGGSGTRTRLKLLAERGSGEVLALHMAGGDAPEIVQSLAVALSAGATKADFDRTVAMHPTAAEEFVLLRSPRRTLN